MNEFYSTSQQILIRLFREYMVQMIPKFKYNMSLPHKKSEQKYFNIKLARGEKLKRIRKYEVYNCR